MATNGGPRALAGTVLTAPTAQARGRYCTTAQANGRNCATALLHKPAAATKARPNGVFIDVAL